MKRILTTYFALCACLCAVGQTVSPVGLTDVRLDRRDDRVVLEFAVEAAEGAVGRKEVLTVVPALVNGGERVEFAPVVVLGKRAAVSYLREHRDGPGDAVVAFGGRRAKYAAELPFREWMSGGSLVLAGFSEMCAARAALSEHTVVAGLFPAEPVTVEIAVPVEKEPLPTAAQQLARRYDFILPASQRKDIGEEGLSREDRYASATIYFRQGSNMVERDYRQNGRVMDELAAAINIINASADSRVSGVVIAGFASPEGSLKVNMALAGKRAEAARELLLNNTAVEATDIEIYNGDVDWGGLRMLVEESRMPGRDEVLEIIDNVPIWDGAKGRGRHGELMRLQGGEPYRYMMRNFFPELRNAAYIRVYYSDK